MRYVVEMYLDGREAALLGVISWGLATFSSDPSQLCGPNYCTRVDHGIVFNRDVMRGIEVLGNLASIEISLDSIPTLELCTLHRVVFCQKHPIGAPEIGRHRTRNAIQRDS